VGKRVKSRGLGLLTRMNLQFKTLCVLRFYPVPKSCNPSQNSIKQKHPAKGGNNTYKEGTNKPTNQQTKKEDPAESIRARRRAKPPKKLGQQGAKCNKEIMFQKLPQVFPKVLLKSSNQTPLVNRLPV
jgi:hypothetical protein